jgi:hypothetical protein
VMTLSASARGPHVLTRSDPVQERDDEG